MSILKGHLEHFGLQELLQTLSQGARSGTLEISRDDEKVSIVFETGHITLVRTGSSRQLRLRSILLREGLVSAEELEQAGKDHEETGILLGRALIDRGFIAEKSLEKALRKKIEEELFDLFLWTNGNFEFFPEQLKSTHEDDVYHVTRIQVDPMSVIIEGLRQADEWTVIRQRIHNFKWILIPVEGRPQPAENHAIYKLVDGFSTLEEILDLSPLTRFDTCTILYRFLEEEVIREADPTEMIRRARDRASETPESALSLYETLLEDQKSQASMELIEEASDCAGHANPAIQADFLRNTISLLLAKGEEKEAWKKLQRLLVLNPGQLEDLLTCWQIRNSIPTKKIPQIHEDLCKALRKCGDHQQLVTVLREAENLRGNEGAYWLQLGEALSKTKDPGAHECLKKAISISKFDAPEIALRAEKSLRTLSPEQGLDEKSLEEILQRQNELETQQQRKKLITISLGSIFCMILIFQISSEWRAGGMLAAAREIESNANAIHHFITAAEAYERVEQLHPWTFSAGHGSKNALRMRNLISREVSSEKDELHRSREEARAQRQSLRNRVDSAILESNQFLEAGMPLKARSVLDKISTLDLTSLPTDLIESIRYPVVVESIPAGALVFDNSRNLLGTSPVTISLSKEEQFEMVLEKKGCRSRKLTISAGSVPHLLVSLVRSPERTMKIPEPANDMAILGEWVLTSGRDGKIRILSRDLLSPVETLSVGIEGHPAPKLIESNGEILALPLAGKPVAISDTGKTRELGQVNGAPWTTAIGCGEEGWALGDANGNISFHDSTGQLTMSFKMPAPIVSLVLAESGEIVAIDAMRNCQHFTPAGEPVALSYRIPGDHFSSLSDGSMLFTEGALWSHEEHKQVPAPKSLPRSSGNLDFYNTSKGWVIYSNHEAQENIFSVSSTCSPLGHSTDSSLVWVAGVDGILRLFDLEGEILGEVALGAEATDMTVIQTGEILVSLSDGTLCVVKEQGK